MTGWAFVPFVAVSLAWVTPSIANRMWSVVVQNGLLMAVNGWGIWRNLLSAAKKRKIVHQHAIAEQTTP